MTDVIELAPRPLLVALIALVLLDGANTALGGFLALSLCFVLDALLLVILVALCVITVRRYQERERRRQEQDKWQARRAVVRRGS